MSYEDEPWSRGEDEAPLAPPPEPPRPPCAHGTPGHQRCFLCEPFRAHLFARTAEDEVRLAQRRKRVRSR